nr:nucleotidyl transferase AbiEii/AbiGii toxin family protein [Celeribacter baekdonensis]
MNAERTFWEKATAIHAYCLRGAFRGGDRYARHWYDLDRLQAVGVASKALENRALAQDYRKMQEVGLLQSDAIAFDELMACLMHLQDQANVRSG